MKKYLMCLAPVLLVDFLIYVVGLIYIPVMPDMNDWRVRIIEALQYLLAGAIGVLAGWIFGSITNAVVLGLGYWLLWRPLLFAIGASYYVIVGSMASVELWGAFAAFSAGVLLLSPVALVASWIGGFLGRRFLYSRQA